MKYSVEGVMLDTLATPVAAFLATLGVESIRLATSECNINQIIPH